MIDRRMIKLTLAGRTWRDVVNILTKAKMLDDRVYFADEAGFLDVYLDKKLGQVYVRDFSYETGLQMDYLIHKLEKKIQEYEPGYTLSDEEFNAAQERAEEEWWRTFGSGESPFDV